MVINHQPDLGHVGPNKFLQRSGTTAGSFHHSSVGGHVPVIIKGRQRLPFKPETLGSTLGGVTTAGTSH